MVTIGIIYRLISRQIFIVLNDLLNESEKAILTSRDSLRGLDDRHKSGSESLRVDIERSLGVFGHKLSLLLDVDAKLLFPHLLGIEFVENTGHDVLSTAIIVAIPESVVIYVLALVLLRIVILGLIILLGLLSSFDSSLGLWHFLTHLI